MGKANLTLSYFSRVASAPSFFKQSKKVSGAEAVATMNGAMSGWLLSRSTLNDVSIFAETLEIAGPTMDVPEVRTFLTPRSKPPFEKTKQNLMVSLER